LAGTLILLSFDIVANTGFFNPVLGGNVVVYQHLFWFYSLPAVYIMVLPAFGLVSEILPIHSRKPLFGYTTMVFSIMGIVVLGLVVWAHHMFTSGTPPWMRLFFTIATAFIAVPTGIKFFNWVATLWGGKISLNAAMLFYDKDEKIQVRLKVECIINHNNDVTKESWSKTQHISRKCYLVTNGPGTISDKPTSGLDNKFDKFDFTKKESEEGYKNFCVIRCKIKSIEWLYLAAKGHRRALIDLNGPKKFTWLVP